MMAERLVRRLSAHDTASKLTAGGPPMSVKAPDQALHRLPGPLLMSVPAALMRPRGSRHPHESKPQEAVSTRNRGRRVKQEPRPDTNQVFVSSST
jgi:hypothetical protein